MVFDRALTDVIRCRRSVGEAQRRLSEARSIIEALQPPEGMHAHPWVAPLGEAIHHLAVVEEELHTLLDRQRGPR